MEGASPPDITCFEKKLAHSGIIRDDWWPPGEGEHEITFAFHLRSGDVIWYEGSKSDGDKWKADYYSNPQWITGTADWISKVPGGVGIDDLKTGRWPVSAQDNKQLLTYAMPFWMDAGQPARFNVRTSITQWPRYPLNGLPQRNFGRATGLDMAVHLADLRWALDHPGEANPTEDNCRFCESKNFCTAFIKSGRTGDNANG